MTSPAGSDADAKRTAWYATLPSFTANAGALITDPGRGILLVKPSYRTDWTLPGGVTEANESPRQCAEREVEEEVGLRIAMPSLLVVQWAPPASYRRAIFGFVFDGGTLTDPGQIRLQRDELDDYAFLPVEDALARVAAGTTAPRLAAAVKARRDGHPMYLEGSE